MYIVFVYLFGIIVSFLSNKIVLHNLPWKMDPLARTKFLDKRCYRSKILWRLIKTLRSVGTGLCNVLMKTKLCSLL